MVVLKVRRAAQTLAFTNYVEVKMGMKRTLRRITGGADKAAESKQKWKGAFSRTKTAVALAAFASSGNNIVEEDDDDIYGGSQAVRLKSHVDANIETDSDSEVEGSAAAERRHAPRPTSALHGGVYHDPARFGGGEGGGEGAAGMLLSVDSQGALPGTVEDEEQVLKLRSRSFTRRATVAAMAPETGSEGEETGSEGGESPRSRRGGEAERAGSATVGIG